MHRILALLKGFVIAIINSSQKGFGVLGDGVVSTNGFGSGQYGEYGTGVDCGYSDGSGEGDGVASSSDEYGDGEGDGGPHLLGYIDFDKDK